MLKSDPNRIGCSGLCTVNFWVSWRKKVPPPSRWPSNDPSLGCQCPPCTAVPRTDATLLMYSFKYWIEKEDFFLSPDGFSLADTAKDAVSLLCCKNVLKTFVWITAVDWRTKRLHIFLPILSQNQPKLGYPPEMGFRVAMNQPLKGCNHPCSVSSS